MSCLLINEIVIARLISWLFFILLSIFVHQHVQEYEGASKQIDRRMTKTTIILISWSISRNCYHFCCYQIRFYSMVLIGSVRLMIVPHSQKSSIASEERIYCVVGNKALLHWRWFQLTTVMSDSSGGHIQARLPADWPMRLVGMFNASNWPIREKLRHILLFYRYAWRNNCRLLSALIMLLPH